MICVCAIIIIYVRSRSDKEEAMAGICAVRDLQRGTCLAQNPKNKEGKPIPNIS